MRGNRGQVIRGNGKIEVFPLGKLETEDPHDFTIHIQEGDPLLPGKPGGRLDDS